MSSKAIPATYISASSFKVGGDLSRSFSRGRRVKANCGSSGALYVTVSSTTVNADGDTEVVTREEELTPELSEVLFSVIGTGADGGLPVHDHSDDDQGGPAAAAADHGGGHVDGTDDVPAFVGATPAKAGIKGLVPAPAAGDEGKVLRGDGTWAEPLTASDMRRYSLIYGI